MGDLLTRRLRFGLPGTELNGGAAGSPDIPVIQRLIAIPKGSTPVLSPAAVVARAEFLADLYPSQPSAMDDETDPPPPNPDDWLNPPYTFDSAAYLKNEMFPTAPA
jgi:hypothetical protein